jgi:ATP-dependent exoDNAse (exonuclease V) beta subunit
MNDAPARERIRSDLSAALVVEAAAGTGKTTELVARIVALVRSGATSLDRILAVTFTDLAAGEMKLRLRSELENARATGSAEERERLTAALGKLEVAPIGTIHSFCADLLRERPVEARVDPVFEVAGPDEQERLFDQAFEQWFQRAVADPPEGVRRLLRRKTRFGETPPREQLRRAGLDLSEHRDFDGAWKREPLDRKGLLDAAVARLAEVAELAPRAQRPEDWAAQSVAEIARFIAELRRLPRDEDGLEAELHDLSRRRLWNWRGGGKWFAQGLEKQSVLALKEAAKAELDFALEKCGADLAACLREELRPLSTAYEGLKQSAGCLDFLDLLLRARDLVRDDRSVREDLRARFTHVLVDEFQDTDPLQAEILLLIASDSPGSDWRKAPPRAGKLFVVGDPKQSIYRFRRADIALYEDVKALLLSAGAELIHLTTSFRSLPGIQRAVNSAFAPRMQGGTQASYVPLDQHRPDLPGRPAVVALPAPRLYGDRERVVNFRIEDSYPDAVGAFVEFLLRKSGWTVSERDKPAVPLEARHVCLLFKRYRGWDGDLTRDYVDALEARRIPHVLVGGRSYHSKGEVQAMRTAAAAIEWPDDELSVFATLRGPLFALGDDALLLFHERHGKLHPWRADLDTLGPPEVVEALRVLRELNKWRNRRPIAETLSRLLDAVRAHAGIAISHAGEQALANVLRVLELARKFEWSGASSFRAFVDRLANEAERGESSEAPVVEEGTEGVRIMSVHRAKGLEFPVVILCDPCAPAGPRTPSRLVDTERRVWAMPLAGNAPGELLAQKDALLQRDKEEVVRVAYVAATRARDLLVVPAMGDGPVPDRWLEPLDSVVYPSERGQVAPAPGCPPFGKESVLDRPPNAFGRSIAPGLYPNGVVWWDPRALELDKEIEGGVRSHDLLVEGGAPSEETARGHAEWQARRARAIESGQRPSLRVETATARSLAQPEGPAAQLAAVEAREPSRPRGKRFGSLVHAVLAEVPLAAGPAEIARLAAAEGRLSGAAAEEVAAAARAVEAALRHPLLQRAARSLEMRREEPLVHRLADGTLLEGVVDLAFRDDAGWTLVDFKTDDRPESQPAYAAQLRLYSAAIEAATGARVTAAILLAV